MECQWIYLVPDPQAAADAIRQLDHLPSGRIAGFGVVSKPAPDGPDRLYVFLRGKELLLEHLYEIQEILDRFGTHCPMILDDLWDEPAPDFISSGLSDIVRATLSLQYPGQVSLR